MALKNYKLDGALYLASRMVMNNANPPGDAIDLAEGGGGGGAPDICTGTLTIDPGFLGNIIVQLDPPFTDGGMTDVLFRITQLGVVSPPIHLKQADLPHSFSVYPFLSATVTSFNQGLACTVWLTVTANTLTNSLSFPIIGVKKSATGGGGGGSLSIVSGGHPFALEEQRGVSNSIDSSPLLQETSSGMVIRTSLNYVLAASVMGFESSITITNNIFSVLPHFETQGDIRVVAFTIAASTPIGTQSTLSWSWRGIPFTETVEAIET